MSRPYREVRKPFAVRTVELIRALQLIADSLERIRVSEFRHLITLSGQLRSLLIERSRQADPLLLHLAQILKHDIRVFCMPDVHDSALPEGLRDDLVLHVSGFPITAERQYAAQVEMTFSQLVEQRTTRFQGEEYKTSTLLEWYANKAGGAHYSRQLPEEFADLLALDAPNLQPVANLLVQIGDATLMAGGRLLKSVVDLELHALLVVPPQSAEHIANQNIVFDARYEGSAMRLTVALNKRLMPSLYVSGLQGLAVRVAADRLIDWTEPRQVYAAVRIEDDLSMLIELCVDGILVGRSRVKEPLFVLSDPRDYELYWNRAVDGEPQQFSFALGEFVMVGSEVGPLDRAKLQVYFDEKRQKTDLPLVIYEPEAYGYAPRGTNDLTMTGAVRRVKARDLLHQPRQ